MHVTEDWVSSRIGSGHNVRRRSRTLSPLLVKVEVENYVVEKVIEFGTT